MKRLFTLTILICFTISFSSAQEDECSQRYREKVFTNIEFNGNVLFGSWTTKNGGTKHLRYDVYSPKDDTAALRPLVILWHGGAFLDLFKKNSPDIVMLARDLAKMGYVVISPDYRGIRDATDFFRKEDLVKEVVGAAIDGNKAICHILSEINNGNPYRINKDEIFAGGVSGGAVLGLHLILLERAEDLPAELIGWAKEVDNGAIDEALANKYCGNSDVIKGFFSISGAIVDTSFIHHSSTGFVHFHGKKDDIVPYNIGQPLFGFTDAPDLYGSKPVHEKNLETGTYSKLYSYDNLGHVPFLNLDINNIFSQLNIINQDVYIETLQAMVDYMFERITCEAKSAEEVTGIRRVQTKELSFFPNPSEKYFQISMQENKQWQVQVFDLAGKIIQQSNFNGNRHQYFTDELAKGMYVVQISDLQEPDNIYVGKIIKQ